MKKVLVINTKYQKYGGEDSNFVEEINFLKKFYEVDYLIYDNSKKLNLLDIIEVRLKSSSEYPNLAPMSDSCKGT